MIILENLFAQQAQNLLDKAWEIVNEHHERQSLSPLQYNPHPLQIPPEFAQEFFHLVDKVNLSLLEDQDNFYGYFLLQMAREIRFDLASPTGVNFKGAKYVIHFNPLLFLDLSLPQMESTIKHEILHILSGHLIRAQKLKGQYSPLAINMAMNIVVNSFLEILPPYSVTLEWVNMHFGLKLLPFKPFEYYVEELEKTINLIEATDEENMKDTLEQAKKEDLTSSQIAFAYDPEKTHDLWEESQVADEKTLQEFTDKYIAQAEKGTIPGYLENLLASLQSSKGELPWNLYLKKIMGTVESNKKKTITRRNRRQPERLELRGELRSHKAKILVALDISGSISDESLTRP